MSTSASSRRARVAWRTLHNVFTTPSLLLPSLMFPLFNFTAFAGGLYQSDADRGFDFARATRRSSSSSSCSSPRPSAVSSRLRHRPRLRGRLRPAAAPRRAESPRDPGRLRAGRGRPLGIVAAMRHRRRSRRRACRSVATASTWSALYMLALLDQHRPGCSGQPASRCASHGAGRAAHADAGVPRRCSSRPCTSRSISSPAGSRRWRRSTRSRHARGREGADRRRPGGGRARLRGARLRSSSRSVSRRSIGCGGPGRGIARQGSASDAWGEVWTTCQT